MSVGSKEIYEAVYQLMPLKTSVVHSGAFVYEVATHLGLNSPDDLGTFDSGKPKMSSFVNNALKKMCGENLAHKIGRGKYKYGAQPQVAQPQVAQPQVAQPQVAQPQVAQPQVVQPQVVQPQVVQPQVVQPQVVQPQVEKPQVEVAVEKPQVVQPQVVQPQAVQPQVEVAVEKPQANSEYLYDIRCPSTVAFLASITPCWTKHKASDSECQKCPLANQCENAKLEIKRIKEEQKQAELEQVAKLEAVGVSELPKPDPNADLSGALRLNLVVASHCVVSGEPLKNGEEAVFVPNWGTLKPEIAEAMGISV